MPHFHSTFYATKKMSRGNKLRKINRSSGYVQTAANAAAFAYKHKGKIVQAAKYARKYLTPRKPSETKTKRKYKAKASTLGKELLAVGAISTKRQALTLGSGKSKPKHKSNMTYDHSFQKVIENIQGLQGIGLLNMIMPRQDGNSNVSILRSNEGHYGTNLFTMTPRYKTATGGIYPVDLDITANNDEFYLNSVTSVINITNFAKTSALVDIYWMAPVKNETKDPTQVWNEVIQDRVNGQSNVIVSTTLTGLGATAGAIGGASDGIFFYGLTPQQSSEYKKRWVCKKKNTFSLECGQTKNLVTLIKYNKTIRFKDHEAAESTYITGCTLVPLVVLRSAPVIVETTASSEEVTYGSGKIGFIHHQKLSMSMLTNKRIKTHRLFQGILSRTSGIEEIVDEDGDVTFNAHAGTSLI